VARMPPVLFFRCVVADASRYSKRGVGKGAQAPCPRLHHRATNRVASPRSAHPTKILGRGYLAGLPTEARECWHRPPSPRLRRATFALLRERRLVPWRESNPHAWRSHRGTWAFARKQRSNRRRTESFCHNDTAASSVRNPLRKTLSCLGAPAYHLRISHRSGNCAKTFSGRLYNC
jgi:hypothetical protein